MNLHHRPHLPRPHLHRPSDRHVGEAIVYLLALAVMGVAVLLQIGPNR